MQQLPSSIHFDELYSLPTYSKLTLGEPCRSELKVCTMQHPRGNGLGAEPFNISGSVIFNDNSSSRISFKVYKYIPEFIFTTFWVLEKKKKKGLEVAFFLPVHSTTSHLDHVSTPSSPPSLPHALSPASQARNPGCRTSHARVSAHPLHIQ